MPLQMGSETGSVPYDHPMVEECKRLAKAGKITIGYDMAGTSKSDERDKDIVWNDLKSVKESAWFSHYSEMCKQSVTQAVKMDDGIVHVVCISGGLLGRPLQRCFHDKKLATQRMRTHT